MHEDLRKERTAPQYRDRDRLSGRIEAKAELLMAPIGTAPDITLAELRGRPIE